MCGLSALFCFIGQNDVLQNIVPMTDSVRHRGPDDEGFAVFSGQDARVDFFGGRDTPYKCYGASLAYAPSQPFSSSLNMESFAAFGHRRLSILDLSSAGHQPMCSEDKGHVIIYNGEVYNYVELRKELEKIGCRFVSRTDTEVILHSYRLWGKECLQKFNGMFSFLIFDRQEKKVFAARDRYGVKPLYYWYSPHHFLAFASEIKQFTILPGWKAVLNKERAYDFLRWQISDATSETLFDGVYQLCGGEYVECEISELKNNLPVRRWYVFQPKQFQGTFEESVKQFHELFVDSVRLRLRSDVPFGYSLSGGIDSSSIVCVAEKCLGLSVGKEGSVQKTFSACSEHKDYDEREFIDKVMKEARVEGHFVFPSFEGFLQVSKTLLWHMDEPFISSSIFAQWEIYKAMSQHGVIVALNGHGADELLAGYYHFFYARFAELFGLFGVRKLWKEIKETTDVTHLGAFHYFRHIMASFLPGFLHSSLSKMTGSADAGDFMLNKEILNTKTSSPEHYYKTRHSTVNQLSRVQLLYTSLPIQLHWVDRSSMAHSVESRQPFMDHRIVEFAAGLPGEYKLANGVTKKVLREAMEGIVPEDVRRRKDKMGFVTPEELWFRTQLSEKFLSLLRQSVEQSRGVLRENVLAYAESVMKGKKPFSFLFWRLMMFGQWMEQFSVFM